MASDSFIAVLQRAALPLAVKRAGRASSRRDESAPACLPPLAFAELAALVSDYSAHARTRTVIWRGGKLTVDRAGACTDSRKDTYLDDGPVARAYLGLLSALLMHANDAHRANDVTAITALGTLYCHLTTLRPDACNQENAASFAELLQSFTPESMGPAGKGKRATRRKGTPPSRSGGLRGAAAAATSALPPAAGMPAASSSEHAGCGVSHDRPADAATEEGRGEDTVAPAVPLCRKAAHE
jgi:hypothetical protein